MEYSTWERGVGQIVIPESRVAVESLGLVDGARQLSGPDLALPDKLGLHPPQVSDLMPAEALSPLELVLGASTVVQLVMLVLVAMSVASWFIIGVKWFGFGRAVRTSRKFLSAFWEQAPSAQARLYALEHLCIKGRDFVGSPVAAVFRAGHTEVLEALRPGGQSRRASWPPTPAANTEAVTLSSSQVSTTLDSVERAMRRANVFELTRLENLLAFLATTGSITPFIGLFGTVWGIMNAFISIQSEKAAGLDVVAPGIAEALIATALGLAAAIPAVMAYNYFVRRLRVLESEIESFSHSYLNTLQRALSQ